jgi:hypothetical protein
MSADMTHSKLNALMFAFGVKRTSRDYLVCCRHLLDQRKVYPWPKGGQSYVPPRDAQIFIPSL